MMRNINISVILLLITVLVSCNKEEGEGGQAIISGRVMVKQYDRNYKVLQDSFYAGGKDVYIVYGDDETFSDDTETGFDGTYNFKFLRPGDYTVFAYSEDTADNESGKEITVIKKVNISKKEERVEIEDIVICESLEMNEGTASISGNVFEINYMNNFTVIKDTSFAQEEDVYIIFNDDPATINDRETHKDGSFRFDNLIKGDYEIYVYSEDTTGATQDIPIVRNISIDQKYQEETVEDLYVRKK